MMRPSDKAKALHRLEITSERWQQGVRASQRGKMSVDRIEDVAQGIGRARDYLPPTFNYSFLQASANFFFK